MHAGGRAFVGNGIGVACIIAADSGLGAVLGAGSVAVGYIFTVSVAGSLDLLALGLFAAFDGAVIGLFAFTFATGLGGHFALVPSMGIHGSDLGDAVVADGKYDSGVASGNTFGQGQRAVFIDDDVIVELGSGALGFAVNFALQHVSDNAALFILIVVGIFGIHNDLIHDLFLNGRLPLLGANHIHQATGIARTTGVEVLDSGIQIGSGDFAVNLTGGQFTGIAAGADHVEHHSAVILGVVTHDNGLRRLVGIGTGDITAVDIQTHHITGGQSLLYQGAAGAELSICVIAECAGLVVGHCPVAPTGIMVIIGKCHLLEQQVCALCVQHDQFHVLKTPGAHCTVSVCAVCFSIRLAGGGRQLFQLGQRLSLAGIIQLFLKGHACVVNGGQHAAVLALQHQTQLETLGIGNGGTAAHHVDIGTHIGVVILLADGGRTITGRAHAQPLAPNLTFLAESTDLQIHGRTGGSVSAQEAHGVLPIKAVVHGAGVNALSGAFLQGQAAVFATNDLVVLLAGGHVDFNDVAVFHNNGFIFYHNIGQIVNIGVNLVAPSGNNGLLQHGGIQLDHSILDAVGIGVSVDNFGGNAVDGDDSGVHVAAFGNQNANGQVAVQIVNAQSSLSLAVFLRGNNRRTCGGNYHGLVGHHRDLCRSCIDVTFAAHGVNGDSAGIIGTQAQVDQSLVCVKGQLAVFLQCNAGIDKGVVGLDLNGLFISDGVAVGSSGSGLEALHGVSQDHALAGRNMGHI